MRPDQSWFALRQRVEWVALVLALLVVASLSWYDLQRERETIAQVERDRIEHDAAVIAGNIGRQLREIGSGLELLRSLLRTPAGKLDHGAVAPARLAELAATMGGVSSMAIADADTAIVASTSSELVGRSFRGSDRDRTMRSGSDPGTLYVFAPYVTALGRYTIGVAKVLPDERGQFGGFVFVGLDPAYFDTMLRGGLYGPDDLRLGLIHGDGKLVYRVPVEEALAGVDFSASPDSLFLRHRRSGEQASVMTGFSAGTGEHRLSAFRTIDPSDAHADKPLVVFASRSVDAMFAPWRRELAVRTMLLVALAVVSAGGMAYVQRRRRAYARLEAAHEAQGRRARQELGIAEQRWKFALEGSAQGVWDWNLTSHKVYYSPRYKAMLGYDPQDLGDAEDEWSGRIHPDDRSATFEAVQRHFRGELPFYEFQFRMRRKDGRYAWIESRGMLVERTADGKPARMIGTHVDVTQRREQESELREANALLERTQFALESVGTAIYWADAASGRFVSANGAAAAMLGYSRDELTHMAAPDIEPGLTAERYQAVAREIAAKGFLRFETTHRRKDGGLVPVEMTVYHFAGPPARYVAFGVDITRRKADEQALRDLAASLEAKVAERSAQFAAASAAKSVFLANMSHEIRTPLNAILGLAQVLEQAAPAGSEQLDLAERIRDAGTVLLRTLNDVLDLSKIEAGQLQVERRPFRVGRLVENVARLTRSMAIGKGLGLRIDVGDCESLHLNGDAVRVEQVLLNLFSNAVKFTTRGDIELTARIVARGAGTVRLRFEVRDQGIGIPADKIAVLFAPFTQADSSIARRYGGTGLGLAISKRLVELMGGAIGVDSVEGAGSTFWFELPFDLAAPPAAGTPTESRGASSAAGTPGGPLRGLRVLVVDDSRMNLDVAERLLKRDGATVALAGDGQQALEILHARPGDFDVVLMDIQMPVLDGLSATRKIRQDPQLARLPVVALTAGVMPEEREAASVAGIDDFLPKPLDLKQMRAMLARYCPAAVMAV